MKPTIVSSQYAIPFDSEADRTRRIRAARQAFDVLGRLRHRLGGRAASGVDDTFLLYRFAATGQWSWAVPKSPIAEQLHSTGEAYLGAPVDRLFQVSQ